MAVEHEPVARMNGGGVWSVATWVACSCGWNEDGDQTNKWLDHFADSSVCENCDHPWRLHTADGCEYTADRPDPYIGQVAYECGCKNKQ